MYGAKHENTGVSTTVAIGRRYKVQDTNIIS